MFRPLLLCASLAAAVFAQPNPYPNPTIRNAASSSTAIAPGSYVSINVAPVSTGFALDAVFTLTTADGVGAQLTPVIPPGAPTGPNNSEIWVAIPTNASLGTALLAVGMRGLTYSNFIEIVPTAPGLFTSSYNGFGPALALNHPSTRNALTSTAVPGGIVSLFATGLGGASTADVSVEIAGQTVAPLYAGPQGQPGLDQINFVVPQNTTFGCYVPVSIRVRGVVSNQTTISINGDPLVCAHPLLLSYLDLKTLDAGGSIHLAQLTFNSSQNIVDGQPLIESAGLGFPVGDATMVAVLSGVQTVATQTYDCVLVPVGGGVNVRRGFGGQAAILDVGTVTLAGPGGQRLELERLRFYSSDTPSPSQPYFTGGIWNLSATGGSDINAFKRDFLLPPPLKFTNLSDTTSMPSQGYTLNWDGSGFGPGDIANITISATGASSYAYCIVPGWMGQLAIPEAVLANFKGKLTSFYTTVQTIPVARQMFTVPGTTGEFRGFLEYYFSQRINAKVE